jgi:GH43 family beta-xylosidase
MGFCLTAAPGQGEGSDDLKALPLKDDRQVRDRFYQNTMALSEIGDPFILVQDSMYYCFATGRNSGFFVWQTDRLGDWGNARSTRQVALEGSQWATGHYWAPEVYEYQGRYVMLYSACYGDGYDLRLGIAFADKPEGPYVDPLDRPLLDPGYCAIDASLFVEDDGTPYLFYVRDCEDNIVAGKHESHTYGVQLSPDLLTIVGEPACLTKPDAEWEFLSDTTNPNFLWNEGVYVLKHEGRYYLYYSANYTGTKYYAVGVAVSESVLGPYVKQGNNPILRHVDAENGVTVVAGPGHNSFFRVGDELFTAYHVNTHPADPTMNRTLCYDRAGFHRDGTAYINGPTIKRQLLPLETLKLRNAMAEATADAVNDPQGLLTDGDYCVAASSAGYVWQGTQARFSWEKPMLSDMMVLHFAGRQQGTCRVILNESYVADIDLAAASGLSDANQIFYFEEMEIKSLRLEMDQPTNMGEIVLLAK